MSFYRRTPVLTKDGIYHIEHLVGKEVEVWHPYEKTWKTAYVDFDEVETVYHDLIFKNGVELCVTYGQKFADRDILEINRNEYLSDIEVYPENGLDYLKEKRPEEVKTEYDFPYQFLALDKYSKILEHEENLKHNIDKIYLRWFATDYVIFLLHIDQRYSRIITGRYEFDFKLYKPYWSHYKPCFYVERMCDKYYPYNQIERNIHHIYHSDEVYSVYNVDYFTLGNLVIVNGND